MTGYKEFTHISLPNCITSVTGARSPFENYIHPHSDCICKTCVRAVRRARVSARTLRWRNRGVRGERARSARCHVRPPRAPRAPRAPPPPSGAGVTKWTIRMLLGDKLNGQRLIEFTLARESAPDGDESVVASATLYVRAEVRREAAARPLRFTLWAFDVAANASAPGELAGAARRDPAAEWQRLDVTAAARRWLRSGAARFRLLLDCSGCGGRVRLRLGGGEGARPMLRLRVAAAARKRARRTPLDCDAAPRGHCCKQSFYVSFRRLGWDDWIVAPDGYYANYCRGACARTPDTFLNYYTHVLEEARRVQRLAGLAPCCAPLRFSAVSLIYFGPDSSIIKRDLPKMVVDECGCP